MSGTVFDRGMIARSEKHAIASNRLWMIPAISVLIAAATWMVFGDTLRYDFVNFDDDLYVYNNPWITRGLTLEGIRRAFSHTYCNYWAPLVALSHMLDCQFYGLWPGGHHLTNVRLHGATAVLLFLVLWKMTGAPGRSAFVASVFSIHPLCVESVAWVTERKDVLSGLFFVLTLGAYVSYVRHLGGKGSTGRYLAVVFLFAMGLMSKPTVVTLPFALLLLDYWPLNRFGQRHSADAGAEPLRRQNSFSVFKHLVIEKIPLFALSAGSCAVTILTGVQTLVPVEQRTIAARLGNAITSSAAYLGQTFYPANLALFYPFPANGIPVWKIILSLALLAFVTAAVFVLRRSRPYMAVGWFWYVGMLVPIIGLIQSGEQAHADRYMYLPQIGLLLLIAWGTWSLCTSLHHRSVALGAGAVMVVAALMVCARSQASHWNNSESVWTHTLACTSDNYIAHNNLGTALLEKGQVDQAARHFEKALEIQRRYVQARNNLGNVWFQKGRVQEAVADYQKALEINPRFADAHYNLGVAFLQTGRVQEAVAHFQDALTIEPDLPKAEYNLGLACVRLGRLSDAVIHYNKALAIDPNYAEAEYNLGVVLAQLGRLNEAVSHYNKALLINPKYAEAHNNLGTAFTQIGREREAIAHFRQAMSINPSNVEALNNTAFLLATSPDTASRNGAEAVALAERASNLSGNSNANIGATLAAAYAETGRFTDAVRTANSALQLAKDQGNIALADAIRRQIKLYQSAAPYHRDSQTSVTSSPIQQ
jgi:tetratricopeptide (TPR) repeat protein